VGRYRGPTCKLARREGTDLLLKSHLRDIKTKCRFETLPGVARMRGRLSDYGIQLRMKQLIRRYYGVSEKQFKRYYEIADHRKGATGTELLRIIESRLDNVVYRLGFAATRAEARQLISHKAILVNDDVVNVASYRVKPSDVISVRNKAKSQMRIKAAMELSQRVEAPSWLSLDVKAMSGVFKAYPEDDDFPVEFKINLVVELYSK
jgi:small subunit ribosomal protein S4